MKLKGLITALITPFKEGLIDEEGLVQNIEFQIQNKVDSIIVLGTTGESSTLSKEEQACIIKLSVKQAGKRIPILVGTGHNSTEETIARTKLAKELGADGALIVTPYYNRPTQEGIFRHFQAITQAAQFPIMVYNVPSRTGANIETQTLARIAELEGVFGIKEASGSIVQAVEIIDSISNKNSRFALYSGDDALALPLISLGAQGVISVVSNLIPKQMSELVHAALSNDFIRARKIHFELLPIFKAAFIETNPIPIKEAMHMCGMPAGACRLPLWELERDNKLIVKESLLKLKLLLK